MVAKNDAKPATLRHDSMGLATGSVIFSVQSMLFKLPVAILERNSTVLVEKSAQSNDETSPIVLDDSKLAFTELVNVLLNPFTSCLDRDHPSSKDLKKLLLLLSISHKYSVSGVESRATALLSELITPATVRTHLGPFVPDACGSLQARLDDPMKFRLSPTDALELSVVAGCDKMSTIFRDSIRKDIWGGKIPSYDAFCSAARIGDQTLIGVAGYMLICEYDSDESLAQANLPGLSSPQRKVFRRARARYAGDWEMIAEEWGQLPVDGPDFGPSWREHNHKWDSNVFLGRTWREVAAKKLSSCDVLGRIGLALDIALLSAVDSRTKGPCKPCCTEVGEYFDKTSSRILDTLGSRFIDASDLKKK